MQAHNTHHHRDHDFVVAPSGASIERAAVLISQAVRTTSLQLAITTGQIALDACYQGNIEVWRGRRGTEVGLRRLARHPLVQTSPSYLSRCIGIFEMEQRLTVSALTSLSVSHFREVLRLPDPKQLPLLLQAQRERWTVRQLAISVAAELTPPLTQVPDPPVHPLKIPSPHGRPGPKPTPALFRNARRMAGDPETRVGSVVEVRAMSQIQREQTRVWLTHLKTHLEALLSELGDGAR